MTVPTQHNGQPGTDALTAARVLMDRINGLPGEHIDVAYLLSTQAIVQALIAIAERMPEPRPGVDEWEQEFNEEYPGEGLDRYGSLG